MNSDGKKFKSMEGFSLDEQQLMKSSDDPKDFDGEKSKSAKKKRAKRRNPQKKRANCFAKTKRLTCRSRNRGACTRRCPARSRSA